MLCGSVMVCVGNLVWVVSCVSFMKKLSLVVISMLGGGILCFRKLMVRVSVLVLCDICNWIGLISGLNWLICWIVIFRLGLYNVVNSGGLKVLIESRLRMCSVMVGMFVMFFIVCYMWKYLWVVSLFFGCVNRLVGNCVCCSSLLVCRLRLIIMIC